MTLAASLLLVGCSAPPQTCDSTQCAGLDGDAGSGDNAAGPQHVVIDFDELAAWTVVTDQYATWVTFSTDSGSQCEADDYAQGNNSSVPNYLACGSYPNFEANIDLKFTAPAQNLQLRAVGVNSKGAAGTIRIFQNGSSTPATFTVNGAGSSTTPVAIDLSSYSDITEIQIVDSTDFDGFGIDDVSFDE